MASGCPSPRAPSVVENNADASADAAPKSGFVVGAPDDPYPVDLENFPGPAHEAWGVYRAKVQCDRLPGSGKAGIPYGKSGLECFGFFPCVGSDDLAKPPPSCAEVEGSAACGDGASLDGYRSPKQACLRDRVFLKPRVAARAIVCMNTIADYACQRDQDDACREHALIRACPDPSVEPSCDAIDKACPKGKRDECRAYLAGLTAQGRAAVITCMKYKVNCDAGVVSCLDRLGEYD